MSSTVSVSPKDHHFQRDHNDFVRQFLVLASALLVAGVAPWPYGYFMVLRLVATGALVATATRLGQHTMPWRSAVAWILAVTFNPIFPVHFDRAVWMVIDVAAGVFLLAHLRVVAPGDSGAAK